MKVSNLDDFYLGMKARHVVEGTGEVIYYRVISVDRVNGLLGKTPISKEEYDLEDD